MKLLPPFEVFDVDEGESPQAEKSVDMGMEGLLTGSAGFGFGTAPVAGSEEAQASLEPQASAFEKFAKLLEFELEAAGVGLGTACDGADGAERLKAELMLEEGAGADCFCRAVGGAGAGLGTGGEGLAKSNKSLDEFVIGGFEGADGELLAKLKSPKSFTALVDKLACGGLEVVGGFGAGFGPVSKNPPPLSGGDVNCGAATDDLWFKEVLKLAKGSGLGCRCVS